MPIGKALLLEACDLAGSGDWQGAHRIVQIDEDDPLSCWLHAIVHRIEGDLGNAAYWYQAAGQTATREADLSAELRAIRTAIEAQS